MPIQIGDTLRTRRRAPPRLFLALPLWMLALAVIGFWPQYYGRLWSGGVLEGPAAHPLVHVHSTLFLAWIAVILLQATLVQSGRTDVHRRLGPWLAGIGYGAAVIGALAGVELAAARVSRGVSVDEAAIFVAAPLLDMMMFAGFLTAAIRYRKRPEAHRVLMAFTGYSFAFIGLVRWLVRTPGMAADPWLFSALLTLPILLCIAWEAVVRNRVHPAWWAGLAVFSTRLAVEFLAARPEWLPVGRMLIRPFL